MMGMLSSSMVPGPSLTCTETTGGESENISHACSYIDMLQHAAGQVTWRTQLCIDHGSGLGTTKD